LKFTSLTDEAYVALSSIADYAHDMVSPTIRLGVTGLSRAGKTVFITSLVHNLIHGGKLPMFAPYAKGKIKRAFLKPQPDDDLPRFAYENHLHSLSADEEQAWPQSTNRISQLRLTIEYEPDSFLSGLKSNQLNVDIVDYPGEWLLDLPLLDLTYDEWSTQTLVAAEKAPRDKLSKTWLKHLDALDPNAGEDELLVQKSAKLFTDYLRKCREDEFALSTVPPGRFLMPGDHAGSPLVTFAPLRTETKAKRGSLHAMMERRYNSYVTHIVKPFFFNHFSRLDRQIVLVDALTALNAGPNAILDLKAALGDILACFRPGSSGIINALLGKRIDKVMFVATKADHLHHTSHDRLEKILRFLAKDAMARSSSSGAKFDVAAMAAIRATREQMITHNKEELPAIIGVPEEGQSLGKKTYNGDEEIALFPGDLPNNPEKIFGKDNLSKFEDKTGFMRFRPPLPIADPENIKEDTFPHIRLDKVLNFLIGDRLS